MTNKIEISRDDLAAVHSKFAQVLSLASMLHDEVNHLSLMLATLPAASTQVAGVAVSAASAGHVDHAEVLRNFEQSATPAPTKPAANVPLMHGPDGILARYLSAEVIRGGQGTLKPGGVLKQHDEDILLVSAARLLLWDEGFYRNSKTSELQLLFKSSDRAIIYRIDGLPGDTPRIGAFVLDRTGGEGGQPVYKDVIFPHLSEALPNDMLMALLRKIASQAEAHLHALSMTFSV